MSILITGGNGFVGRHLSAALGGEAIALTRADADLRRDLPPLPRARVVIHAAATIDGDREELFAVNVEGTRRLVEWSRTHDVETFVFLSTGGIDSGTPYGESKHAAEALVPGAARNTHVVRLYFPYGAGQDPRRLVPRLIASIGGNRPIAIADDGGPRLSLTHIDDVVEAIRRLAYAPGNDTVDLGGEAHSMRTIAATIARVAGRTPLFEPRSSPATDFIADNAKLAALTGFVPRIALAEGIARTWG